MGLIDKIKANKAEKLYQEQRSAYFNELKDDISKHTKQISNYINYQNLNNKYSNNEISKENITSEFMLKQGTLETSLALNSLEKILSIGNINLNKKIQSSEYLKELREGEAIILKEQIEKYVNLKEKFEKNNIPLEFDLFKYVPFAKLYEEVGKFFK
ncbi:MAG: hypothetical protein PHN56_04190 [Candidatus Nanoarchaeia archaeon]|nr:hypothetical protein [Candidatus Nanoarchaeia archaeon]